MTDELTPDPPDQRDEHIAELLEVPPLDEVTRRRLVAAALEAAPAATAPTRVRGRRLLAVAAAAVAVVAVGAGVVVIATGDDGGRGTSTVAGRPEVEKRARTEAGAGDDQAATAPAPEAAPSAGTVAPRDLGDLGDVTEPSRLREAVQQALFADRLEAAPPRLAPPCSGGGLPDASALVAIGTGRFDGTAVVILATTEKAIVLDAADCARRLTLTL